MPRIRIPAYSNGPIFQRRIVNTFNAGIKIVQIAVQYGSHIIAPAMNKNICSISFNLIIPQLFPNAIERPIKSH